MRKVLGLSLICWVGVTLTTYAQYFQFSQYNFSQQRVNPALVGNTPYASISILSRNQKTGGDFGINSNLLSGTYPLLSRSTGKPWSGIGITLMDDRSDGIFKTQEVSLSYAMHLHLNRFQTLSLGFKGLFQTKSISLDGFNTGLQYIPDRGFSNSISTGESLAELRENYNTFSAGLYWQQVDRKETKTAYWGISVFDFNKPKDSFLGSTNHLFSTLIAEGGFRAYQQKQLSVFPEILFTTNSSNVSLNAGMRFQYEIKSMPNQPAPVKIDVITKYVPGRSGIIGLQFHRENFSFGTSYDFPFFANNSGNQGALEICLELRRLVTTRNKKLKARRKKEIGVRKKTSKLIAFKNNTKKKTLDSLTALTVQNQPKEEKTVIDSTTYPKSVFIEKYDSSKIKFEANAGKVNQEPYLVEKITLRFQFKFNSADLDDGTEHFLNDLSKTLEEDPHLSIKIIGHTDNVGSEKFNQRLSVKRAETVKKFLLKTGISQARITVDGKGMRQPLTDNETEEEKATNRRVEILLLKD